MSKATVKTQILEPMLAIYSPPFNTENVPLAMKQYAEVLSGQTEEVLRKAWQRVVRTHEASTWPSPAVILKACDEFRPRPKVVPKERDPEPARGELPIEIKQYLKKMKAKCR